MKTKKDIKQVLIVRKDIKMRQGKTAAQCSHACMAVFFDALALTNDDLNLTYGNPDYYILDVSTKPYFEDFIKGSFKKIVVYVESEQELKDLYQQAKEAKIHTSLIKDAGLTEFGGVPTYTVCAIGPWDGEEINKITGHLPLL